PDEVPWGTALMGSGNRTYGQELRGEGRGTFLTFAHAMRLASHPQFSESVRGMKQEVQTTVSEMALRVEKSQIVVSGKISGTPPVYGVVAYFDPAGHGDYDSLTSTAVPSADGLFEIRSPDLPAGTSGQLRLIPLHVNGAIASPPVRGQLAYSYRVSAEGKPDVEEAALRLELAEFLRALETNQRQLAEAMLSSIQSVRGKRIAGRLLHPPERTLSPQGVAQEVHTIPLSECRPEKVQVGWARPAYDRIPDPAVLLESAGQIFETGIYAHAESVHQYDLGQRWQKLTGQVGLASGQPGSVQFQIRGDGKTLWTSRRIGPEERESFEISVEGLQKLELLTSPTDDGKNNDWGLWLNVRLQRP
ncbi:MAG: NPCBM/NEW2 domain-containing protein, partial [Planctomycetaceae bacterium]|nr:NPCBM/NEW2 domain-containing protein [Planctomycetaceae bacterium]